LALYLIVFTQMLDTSVANLVLSNIASDLMMDVYHASWIVTSFGTGVVIAFPLGAICSKRTSSDLVLSVGCLVFALASLGCGLTDDAAVFILMRLLQGLGSGAAVIAAFPIMISVLGAGRATFAIALVTSAISLAPVSGPIIGAWITAHFGWHMLFLMNVPLTAVAMFLLLPALGFTKPTAPERVAPRLATLSLFALTVALLQYALDFGEQLNWFRSPLITGAVIATAVAGAAFFRLNAVCGWQIFNLGVLRNPTYASTTTVLVIGNGMIFASLVFLPLWFRLDRHMPLLEAGVVVSLGSGVSALATPFIGKYFPREYFPAAALASLLLTAVSFFMMSRFTVDTPLSYLVTARLVAGCGMAIFSTPLITMSLSLLAEDEIVDGNTLSIVLRVMVSNVMVAVSFAQYRHLSDLARASFTANADRISFLTLRELSAPASSHLTSLFHTSALSTIFLVTGAFFAVSLLALLPFSGRIRR
jgi:DHA2 family multidrug resistance protein